MQRALILVLLLSVLIAACGEAAPPASTAIPATRTLTVFAASSLTAAFTQLGRSYEVAHPDVHIAFNFAGSQALRTQLEQGAPADVFASASPKEMDALAVGGYVQAASQHVLVSNRLVVLLPSNNPASIRKLEDLAVPGVKLVLAADDVPVGAYARQSLQKMNAAFGEGFSDSVLHNVVSNEDNVKQVVAKVQLGEADAGIVYVSDAAATPDLLRLEIPPDLNVVAEYPIAPLVRSANSALANDFINYLLTPASQAVLQKWGFDPAP